MRELCASAGAQKFKKWRQFSRCYFKKNYYATADISVRSDNFPTNRRQLTMNLNGSLIFLWLLKL